MRSLNSIRLSQKPFRSIRALSLTALMLFQPIGFAQTKLSFTEGEYSLKSGAGPCQDGFVGWMEGTNNSSFMLGYGIVFSEIGKGKVTRPSEQSGGCSYVTETEALSNELRQEALVTCPQEEVRRVEVAKFEKNKIQYTLKISSRPGPEAEEKSEVFKVTGDISCSYELDRK